MSYKVLLIDDDPNLLPSLVTLLEELTDFTIITAENGLTGLERAIDERPDCIHCGSRVGIQLRDVPT